MFVGTSSEWAWVMRVLHGKAKGPKAALADSRLIPYLRFGLVVRDLAELGVAGPMPGVLEAPALSYVLEHGLGCGPETGDGVTGLLDRLAIADDAKALTAAVFDGNQDVA